MPLSGVKKFDYYRITVLIALPISTALLAVAFMLGAEELILSDWFISLISMPGFIAYQLGTAAYLGRLADIKHYHQDRKAARELFGTQLGMGFGVMVGLGLMMVNYAVPFAGTLSVLATANVLYLVRQVNTYAGLGNRVGRLLDEGSRPWSEKMIVGSGIAMGFTMGIMLIATSSASILAVAGVTSYISAGAIIPTWIAAPLFVLTLSSSIGSTADYIAKAVNYLRVKYKYSHDAMEKDIVNRTRPNEYYGALIGVTLGFIIGITAIAMLQSTQPYLFIATTSTLTETIILSTAMGVIGSICSRIGRFFDPYPLQHQNTDSLTINADVKGSHHKVSDAFDRYPAHQPVPRAIFESKAAKTTSHAPSHSLRHRRHINRLRTSTSITDQQDADTVKLNPRQIASTSNRCW